MRFEIDNENDPVYVSITSLDSRTTVSILNRYMWAMNDELTKLNAYVNKFLGDGMLAYFGAPLARADHRERALACALRMMRALERINMERGLDLRMGIGLHTGEVVLGPVGSPACREYTVIGDAVNVAARLESLTKDLGVPVLASEAVVQGGTGWTVHGTHALRGRKEPVVLYVPAAGTGTGEEAGAA